jgi:hypothetical protein
MTLSSADLAAIVKAIKPLIPTAAQVADAVWAKDMSATAPSGAKVSGSSSYFLRKGLVLALDSSTEAADKGIASAEIQAMIQRAVEGALAKG